MRMSKCPIEYARLTSSNVNNWPGASDQRVAKTNKLNRMMTNKGRRARPTPHHNAVLHVRKETEVNTSRKIGRAHHLCELRLNLSLSAKRHFTAGALSSYIPPGRPLFFPRSIDCHRPIED